MVAFTFDPVYNTLVVFLSALIPGIALGWPFLKKSDLSALEKLLLCFFIGLVLPPMLLVAENIIGLKFSLPLALADLFLLTAAGIAYGVRQNAFSIAIPEIKFNGMISAESAKKHAATLLLLLAVLLAFWIRIQTYTPIYSELDPYFYVYGSGQLIRFGTNPIGEDTAWWPEIRTSDHRNFPSLKMYTEAMWYTLYTGGAEYNNYLLFTTSSWFPPISAMLAAAGAYFLFSSYYGKRYGLLAAYIVAFLPVLIFKMSAGVNEAGPFGMASIFTVIGVYVLALKKNDLKLGILAGITFIAAALGSNYEPVLAFPVAGFLVLQATDYFVRGKRSQGFLEISACLVAGLVVGSLGDAFYSASQSGLNNLLSGAILMAIAAIAFAYATDYIPSRMSMGTNKRIMVFCALLSIAALVILIPNPVGKYAKEQAAAYFGAAEFSSPLSRTIAEQNQAGPNFEGDAGFLALIPASHIAPNANGLNIGWNFIYGSLDLIAIPFTWAGNGAIWLADKFLNAFLGLNISTDEKTVSLLFFFLIISVAGLAIGHFTRKGEDRDRASAGILLLLVMLPIIYIGLHKIKFTIFVGLALAIATVAAIAELERMCLWIAGKLKMGAKKVWIVFAAIIMLVAFAEIAVPSGYPLMIIKKSLEPRYQDNPVAMMPKLAKTCEDLRQAGYYDADICAAGYNRSFADTINDQFNSKVCLVSQLSLKELLPGKSEQEQTASGEAKAGASFRCNRLAEYWIDSMEWIRHNLAQDERMTSWWDYGHWINFFGDRKAVLRNEQASYGMIGRIAHDYIDGTPEELAATMNYFDSRYVLFDVELVGGSPFGGKYGALNYLSCAHDNRTTYKDAPGTSDCEFEHSPERLVISQSQTAGNLCVISESQQRTGVYAYRLTKAGAPESTPVYCVGGDITLGSGEAITPTYYLNKKDAAGDLELNKGFLRQIGSQGAYSIFEMVYNSEPVWPSANGTYVGGMEDAKTKFYTSNLYHGFYLKKLPGFDLVYQSKNGEVKIYKMKNFTGNKAGIVDPVSASRRW